MEVSRFRSSLVIFALFRRYALQVESSKLFACFIGTIMCALSFLDTFMQVQFGFRNPQATGRNTPKSFIYQTASSFLGDMSTRRALVAVISYEQHLKEYQGSVHIVQRKCYTTQRLFALRMDDWTSCRTCSDGIIAVRIEGCIVIPVVKHVKVHTLNATSDNEAQDQWSRHDLETAHVRIVLPISIP